MYLELITVLLISHIIGDFCFQPKALCQRKGNIKFLILHCFLYLIAFILPIVLFASSWWQILLFVFSILLSHFAIDYGKPFIKRKIGLGDDNIFVFIIDQALHVGTVLLFGCLLLGTTNIFRGQISDFIGIWDPERNFTTYMLAKLILSILFLLLPSSYIVQNTIGMIKDEESVVKTGDDNVPSDKGNAQTAGKITLDGGKLIGRLERILVFFSAIFSRWEVAAVVVAVKGLARFGECNKKPFAEKFIVGTLLSLCFSLLAWAFFAFM